MNQHFTNRKLRILMVLIAWSLMSSLVSCNAPKLHCNEMLTLDEVTQILDRHAEVIEKIEAVDSSVTVYVNDSTCPGKAYVVITYATYRHRQAIEEIIAESGIFKNVFYWLQNI